MIKNVNSANDKNRKRNTIKLCYILPFYDLNTGTHYFHLYELIEYLAYEYDVYLFVENASKEINIKNLTGCYVQRLRFFPFRVLEMIVVLLFIRFKGYKKFYIHYSILPALITSIIVRTFGGQNYLWSCVENKAYFTQWRLNFATIKRKLFVDVPTIIAFRLSNYIITCSVFMKNYYRVNFGISDKHISVITNWVNLIRFEVCSEKQKVKLKKEFGVLSITKVVLYLHTISKHRGAHYIPTILKKIISVFPEVVFVIAGDGPYFKKLNIDIDKIGLKSKIRYVGSIPNCEVQRYFGIADVFINPTEREAFGRVLLESMAMGVPFVSTDGGGGVLAFTSKKQQEYIVPVGEIDLFCEKIRELLNDDKKREELKIEGFRVVQDFKLEKACERFKKLVMFN